MKIYCVISGLAPDCISEYGWYIHRENAEKKLAEITPHFSNVIDFPIGIPAKEPSAIYDYDPRIIEVETAD